MPRTPATQDPDALQRQQAGTYRTADERFEVRQADQGWFLVDAQQTDDFGQALVRGPFATLKAVREAIPEARSTKVVSLPRRAAARAKDAGSTSGKVGKAASAPMRPAEPPPPPPSWLDKLPSDERAQVRRVIRALEAEGVTDAEKLVRRDHDGLLPAVATTLIRQRLETILEDASTAERALVKRVVKVLTQEGRTSRGPLPGWSLVELGPEPEPPNRRIVVED